MYRVQEISVDGSHLHAAQFEQRPDAEQFAADIARRAGDRAAARGLRPLLVRVDVLRPFGREYAMVAHFNPEQVTQ